MIIFLSTVKNVSYGSNMHCLSSRLSNFPKSVISFKLDLISGKFLSLLSDNDEARGFVYPFPKKSIIVKTVRSSGPGGQNRDKRESKVQIKVNISQADWVSERTKNSLAKVLDKSGHLNLSDETSRSQSNNKIECLNKLYRLLLEHSYVEPLPSEEELATKMKLEKARKKRRKEINRSKKYYSKRDNPFSW